MGIAVTENDIRSKNSKVAETVADKLEAHNWCIGC